MGFYHILACVPPNSNFGRIIFYLEYIRNEYMPFVTVVFSITKPDVTHRGQYSLPHPKEFVLNTNEIFPGLKCSSRVTEQFFSFPII